MTFMKDGYERCGAENPERPGMRCHAPADDTCVAYHVSDFLDRRETVQYWPAWIKSAATIARRVYAPA